MKFYRLRQIEFWGDYGSILMKGLPAKRDAQNGQLLLERAGPFIPPMVFTLESSVGYIVLVTQSFREKLETAYFGDLAFKPTIKKHIVNIPWQTWDRQARLPSKLPDSGEPEEFVLGQKHSKEAAATMEEIWEFDAPVLPCKIEKRERLHASHHRWYLNYPEGKHRGLFRPPGNGHVLFVDELGRSWFEREGQGWVDFDEVSIQ
jgi:hypothetical protein